MKRRKLFVVVMVLVLIMGLVPTSAVQAKKKSKTKLNKTKVTLTVGKKVQLKLKNAPKGQKIKWSSNKKKIATVTKKGKVTAKKVGKAKITAKVGKKKYTCTVTVKKKTSTDESTTEQNTTQTPTTEDVSPNPHPQPSEDNIDEKDTYTVTGTLKTKSGTIIKESIEIEFINKQDYEKGSWSPITTSVIDKESGTYNVKLPQGEYVVIIVGRKGKEYIYAPQNEKIGDFTVNNQNVQQDLVYSGYYISGTWLRGEDIPITEMIYVRVSYRYGSSSGTFSQNLIIPDEQGRFYWLYDDCWENDTDLEYTVTLVVNDEHILKRVEQPKEDLMGVVWRTDYCKVKGKVLNHNERIEDYTVWYVMTDANVYKLNKDNEFERDLTATIHWNDDWKKQYHELGKIEDADLTFTLYVEPGIYKLHTGAAYSENEIVVDKDMDDCTLLFDAYVVDIIANHTGEAGDNIDEDPSVVLYYDGEERHRWSSPYYIDSILLSPGEYDIRMKVKDRFYYQKITEFSVTDSNTRVIFNY